MMREVLSAEGALSTMRVALADAIAHTVLAVIDQCREEGVPLTPRQERMALRQGMMEYADAVRQADDLLHIEARLTSWRDSWTSTLMPEGGS